jgi:hypothetical protein
VKSEEKFAETTLSNYLRCIYLFSHFLVTLFNFFFLIKSTKKNPLKENSGGIYFFLSTRREGISGVADATCEKNVFWVI